MLTVLIQNPAIRPFLVMGIRGSTLIVKFIMTMFIARFMGFDTLGAYGLITSGCMIVPSITGLSLTYMISRRAVVQSVEEITHDLSYYTLFLTYLYAVLILIAALTGLITGHFFFFLCIAVIIFLEHLNSDVYQLQLNLSKILTANILHFIRSALWMLIFMVLAYTYPALRTIEYLLTAWIIGSSISLLCFVFMVRKWPWFVFDRTTTLKRWLKREIKDARVVYINNVLTTLSQYMNQFLIMFFLGLELTGVFFYYMQIIAALSNLLQTGIVQVTRPLMVRAYINKDPNYKTIYYRCMKYTVAMSLVMSLMAIPLIYVLTTYVVDKPLALEWLPAFGFCLLVFILSMISHVNLLVFYSQHEDSILLKLRIIGMLYGLPTSVLGIYLFGLWGAFILPIFLSLIGLSIQIIYLRPLIKRTTI